jgi:hypothetical protein
MAVFVNYDGPKLDKKQKKAVRSQVMVVVRGLQKKQANLKCQARHQPQFHSSRAFTR